MNKSKNTVFLILTIVGLSSCTSNEKDVRLYIAQKKSLKCEMERLKMKSDSLWNEVANYLESELPPEMEASERENMVKIKNAKLITMFKEFPALDSTIQNTVHRAGLTDEEIAAAMKAVMDKTQKVDDKLNLAFEDLENRNIKTFEQLKLEKQVQMEAPCIFE